jgi:anti-anti-sigma factor
MSATCAHFLVEKTVDGITVATFSDTELLDGKAIGEVEEELRALAYGLGAAPLILNFGRVRLMTSGMLGALLPFTRRFRESGGRLKLCCLDQDLREVFRIARYEGLFEIYPDEPQALDAF